MAALFPHGSKSARKNRAGRGDSAAGTNTGGKKQARQDATGGVAGMLGDRASQVGGGQQNSDKIVSDRAAGTRPMSDVKGATDGLGAGRGGLAVHRSAADCNVDDYQPQHTSRMR